MRYTLHRSPQLVGHSGIANDATPQQWNADGVERVIEQCFDLSSDVRYVSVYTGDSLAMRARDALSGAGAAESDQYEELLVNPALMGLASQRGDIDCGGLRFLLVRYGHFFKCIYPTRSGHVSVTLAPNADLVVLPNLLARLVGESS